MFDSRFYQNVHLFSGLLSTISFVIFVLNFDLRSNFIFYSSYQENKWVQCDILWKSTSVIIDRNILVNDIFCLCYFPSLKQYHYNEDRDCKSENWTCSRKRLSWTINYKTDTFKGAVSSVNVKLREFMTDKWDPIEEQ